MIFEERSISVETGLRPTDSEWWEQFISQSAKSDAGPNVTPTTAMKMSVVFRCWTLIAQTGTLPCKYYHRMKDGGKEIADKKGLWKLLHDQPNPNDTAVEFWEQMFGSLAIRYNAYAQIIPGAHDQVVELWPLLPDKMKVSRVKGKIIYEYATKRKLY